MDILGQLNICKSLIDEHFKALDELRKAELKYAHVCSNNKDLNEKMIGKRKFYFRLTLICAIIFLIILVMIFVFSTNINVKEYLLIGLTSSGFIITFLVFMISKYTTDIDTLEKNENRSLYLISLKSIQLSHTDYIFNYNNYINDLQVNEIDKNYLRLNSIEYWQGKSEEFRNKPCVESEPIEEEDYMV